MNKEVIRVIEENIAEMFDEVESNCVETELILTHIEVAIKALKMALSQKGSKKINLIKQLIKKRDFTTFGELIESEALELHTIMLTSSPSLLYWLPNTVYIMRLVRAWRKEGLELYFTVNTGQDIHIIAEKKNESKIVNKLKKISEVKKIISNYPSNGAQLINKHLF